MLALRLETRSLWTQIVLALAYGVPLVYFGTLTGNAILDGVVGGVLGLYICSVPARYAVDVQFASRHALRQVSSTRAGTTWLMLNGVTLGAGWLVIFLGMTCFIGA